MINVRSVIAQTQAFPSGYMIWMSDVGQVFVLRRGSSWEGMPAADLNAFLSQQPAIADQLGSPLSSMEQYIACVGNTDIGGVVTAYVTTADGDVLSWGIEVATGGHLGWEHVEAVIRASPSAGCE